jgi:hypothetical protein
MREIHFTKHVEFHGQIIQHLSDEVDQNKERWLLKCTDTHCWVLQRKILPLRDKKCQERGRLGEPFGCKSRLVSGLVSQFSMNSVAHAAGVVGQVSRGSLDDFDRGLRGARF